MEFNDVLLYNFFTDSPAQRKWRKSSPDEWNRKGRDYFEQRQYEQAIFCFIKSGNEESRKLSYAYYLRQIARDSKDDSNDDTIKFNFISAAIAFQECSRPDEAAKCYQVEKYDDAAFAYRDGDLEIAVNFILSYKQEIKNKTFRHVARHIKNSYHSVAISDGKFDNAVDI
ncbi:unnamed protein product [Rhizophagus irregularis]|nr:unnamed protein product [Rhizophagus irregularis]